MLELRNKESELISKFRIEIGQLKSYVQELEYELAKRDERITELTIQLKELQNE